MKQLIVLADNGKADASIEDLVASKLNQFKGWHCDAGVQNLYIDFDGEVWVANCASAMTLFQARQLGYVAKEWGYLGKIGNNFTLPTTGISCIHKNCGCGSDIVITKFRGDDPAVPAFIQQQYHKVSIPIESVNTISAVRSHHPLPKQILWDIGRFCNYSCSYCWPGVHNKTDAHKPLSVFKNTANYVIDNWSNGNQIRWYFGGGEPTLNPDFELFVDYLASKGQWVMLVSNGSQGPGYWRKNADNYNTLIFSAHFEFMKPDLFAKNYQSIVGVMKAGAKKLNTYIVKLMTKPNEIQKSIDFVESLKAAVDYNNLSKELKQQLMFDMVPLRDIDDGSQLHKGYTEHELVQVGKFNSR